MPTAFRADTIELGANIFFKQGSADPTAGGGVVAPVGSFYWRTSTFEIYQKVSSSDTAWVFLTARDLFGDGRDGDVTIDAATVQLGSDTYYDDLTIGATGILQPRGYRVFVRGVLTITAGGIVDGNGGNGAANGSAGAASPVTNASWCAAGAAGGAGGVAIGSNGGSVSNAIKSFAGAGGPGGAGTGGAGGAGGVISTQNVASQGNPFAQALAMVGQTGGVTTARMPTGSGGGGGGGDGVAGGGGGGGGAAMCIFARQVVNGGTIRSHGGTGGTPAAGNRGGGGGGGGGLIVLGTHAFSGNTPTVTPGAPGNGSGTGVNGTIGGAGMYVPLAL